VTFLFCLNKFLLLVIKIDVEVYFSNLTYSFGSFALKIGPEFGSPPSYMREKFLTVLSQSGKTSSFIDDISIVKRYSSESSHAFPVCSDDAALAKATKEVYLIMGGKCPFLFLVLTVRVTSLLHLLLLSGEE